MYDSKFSKITIRRNYRYGAVVRVGPPLLTRRQLPNRAWMRDVSLSLGRKTRLQHQSWFKRTWNRARNRFGDWVNKLRSLGVNKLRSLGRSGPTQAFS